MLTARATCTFNVRSTSQRPSLRASPSLARRVGYRVSAKSDDELYIELEKINAANNKKNAEDWISSWSKKRDEPVDEEALAREAEERARAEEARLEQARVYRYIFAHDLLGDAKESFAKMYLSDALGTIGITLESPDLTDGDSPYTITNAVKKLDEVVQSGAKERPVRLIGASTGALVAALYAEQNRNIDKVFLLAPTFCLSSLLDTFEQTYGMKFSDAFRADAATLPDYPTVTCPAYVIHGHDDALCPLDNSARWMQMASHLMRQEGDADEFVAERRLLEVNGMGHSVEAALPTSMGRFTEFFNLPRIDLFMS